MATWEDRVRGAAYTCPNGTRFVFKYEDLSRETPLRNAWFEFPLIDNAYGQQNGFGSRSYPMRCYFVGPQCDLLATAFEAGLMQRGIGRLEHPVYGTIDVIPDGSIVRNDALKSAANQAIVEITFKTTTGIVFPDATKDPQNEILALIAGFDVASAQSFADHVNIKKVTHRTSLIQGIRKTLDGISKTIGGLSSAVSSVNREFQNIRSTVNYGLDVLVGQPLLLARQVKNLISAPSRALLGIQNRLDGYSDLADNIFGSKSGRPLEQLAHGSSMLTRRTAILNDFHTSDLVVSQAVASSVIAATTAPVNAAGESQLDATRFDTRAKAIAAASQISNMFDALVAWRDECFAGFSDIAGVDAALVDTGESIQALQNSVAMTIGYLVRVAFTLKTERSIILDRPRTIIDLCGELYGSVDDRLDFLIATNDLTGSEILEIPRQRKIVYYS